MYHAVMEEVVRFLERCHQSLNVMQTAQQISRSKSVSHVYGHQSQDMVDATLSSTNHHQQGKGASRQRIGGTTILEKPQSLMTMMSLDETTVDISGTDSFAQFKDFTW